MDATDLDSMPITHGTAPTLTGPDGAFAQAERAAGVTHG